MNIEQLFEQAAKESKELSEKPSNDTLLQLYALYKQATNGDNDTPEPSNPFDFVNKAKYEAWKKLTGKPREEAMQEYVNLIDKLKSA